MESIQNLGLSGTPILRDLVNRKNEPWALYSQKLTLFYRKAWIELSVCYLMIGLGVATACGIDWATDFSWKVVFFAFPLGLWIGFWFHVLSCFFHEAVHFNLHTDRRWNDWIANLFIAPFIGLEIKSYRETHWQHHRHLGTTEDSETSYFTPLTLPSLLQGMTGLYILNTIARYAKNHQNLNGGLPPKRHQPKIYFFLGLTISFLFHSLVAGLPAIKGFTLGALSWGAGIILFLPLVSRIRQTLEHRSLQADRTIDYSRTPQGPVNRLFGTNLFSRTLGHAGFNRHLLHHWDPRISYTRFDEMEAFLLETSLATEVLSNKTSYWNTFKEMIRHRVNI